MSSPIHQPQQSSAAFELDLIEAYEEVVRVVAASARPGTARRDLAERVRDYGESLLAVLDRLHGTTAPEWKCFRALVLQLLAVARRFAELSIKVEGDNSGKTPWGKKLPSTSLKVDIVASGCPLPFIVANVGAVAAYALQRQPQGPPPMQLTFDEVTEYIDALVFASCELFCNSVQRFASLCNERNTFMKRKRNGMNNAESVLHSTSSDFYQAGESVDELFVLHSAFEEDDTFARFWARKFGPATLSVPCAELINGLDGEVFAGPDRTRRAVVETAVAQSFDVHQDGMVDVGAIAVITQAVHKAIFPSLVEMLTSASRGPQLSTNSYDGGDMYGAANGDYQNCDRCARLEAELALERRRNAELRAELGTRPKTHYLLTQLDHAHRTIASLQHQLGLNPTSTRGQPMNTRDAHAESDRLRRAVLGVGLQRN